MVHRIDIGPDDGPFVELDEQSGELVIRVPNDAVDFTNSNLSNIAGVNDVVIENHNTRHESGGLDEMTVTGLNGVLADRQDPQTHSDRHENNGEDEINVEGLSGDLADAQDPKVHSGAHGYDSADELATALRYEPQSEPATPTSGCVRWYDNTDEAYKVKFDDGTSITVGEK